MESKIIIFVAATVLIIAIILALTLPPLLKPNRVETPEANTGGKNKKKR